MKFLVILSASLLLLTSCAPQRTRPTASREDIEKASSQFSEAHARGDAESIAAMTTEDVLFMRPNADDLRGSQDVKQALAQVFSTLKLTDFVIQAREINIYDSTAYELATYTESLNFKGKPPQAVRGHYLIVWKLQPDNSWLVHRNLFHLSPVRP